MGRHARSRVTLAGGEPIAHSTSTPGFQQQVAQLFEREFRRVFRVLQRLAGDPDLASDLAQESFVKLLQRGVMPDTPVPWLVTVALNQLRNTRSRDARRHQLLTLEHGVDPPASPSPSPDHELLIEESRQTVRATLSQLSERQAQLLLLSAEGYSYREIGTILELEEGSVGALILRAKRAFRACHTEVSDAP